MPAFVVGFKRVYPIGMISDLPTKSFKCIILITTLDYELDKFRNNSPFLFASACVW